MGRPPSRIIGIGHSYGSTVSGGAAGTGTGIAAGTGTGTGTGIDAIIAAGSPGENPRRL